jgi:hypothetical protein
MGITETLENEEIINDFTVETIAPTKLLVTIKGIKLLDTTAFYINDTEIPLIKEPYWVYDTCAFNDNKRHTCYVNLRYCSDCRANLSLGVRPVLIIRENITPYTKIKNLLGYDWLVLKDGTLLCNECVIKSAIFNMNASCTNYENSLIKVMLEQWLIEKLTAEN